VKIAIIYNYESKAVINLFGIPNRERYGLKTIRAITGALKKAGHQVKSLEGDKNIVRHLEEFMPAVIAGERPGLVFNLSYGIQGRARYTHIPGILEMLGIPYIGSSPDTHALALDKVVTKMILRQRGLPTPAFDVLDGPDSALGEELRYPLIVKPKNEAVSYGLRIVHDERELREGVGAIYEAFQEPTLVEEYIEGREINVGLLGNDPVTALPPVELDFGEGAPIFTYEDKTHRSGREIEKLCPAPIGEEALERAGDLSVRAFRALNCQDFARVDLRLDGEGVFHILEVNSMASLGLGGSYVYAAAQTGLDYDALVGRMVDVASRRYFGTTITDEVVRKRSSKQGAVFSHLTGGRDAMEKHLASWTNLASRTDDPVMMSSAVRKLEDRVLRLGLEPVEELTNDRSAWAWQTPAGLKQGTLLVVHLDSPVEQSRFPVPFRREPEWLFGEAVASSRGGLVTVLSALGALRFIRRLKKTRVGLFAYADEGRGMRYSADLLERAAGRSSEVLVMNPGAREGKVVTQRRGLKKYTFLVEGDPLRMGVRGRSDVLTWFLDRAARIAALSRPAKKLTLMVQDVRTERYSILMPHRIRATIGMTYLDRRHAEAAERRLREVIRPDTKEVRVQMEPLEERPPLARGSEDNPVLGRLASLSEQWRLPFGEESSVVPSAAGVVPSGTPVVCGMGPAGRALFTPNEAVHRGELLQRSLLLALYLGGFA
jgi:D-alanine-D-alanine ligase